MIKRDKRKKSKYKKFTAWIEYTEFWLKIESKDDTALQGASK